MWELLFFLSLGTAIDFEENRVPNGMCLLGGIIGICCTWNQVGIRGVGGHILHMFFIFLLLFPLWHWKVIGGGDVKLFLMSVCYLGKGAWKMLLLTVLIMGIYIICLFVCRRNLQERMTVFLTYCQEAMKSGTLIRYPFDRNLEMEIRAGGVHVSYGILLGYVTYILTTILTNIFRFGMFFG